MYEAMLVIYLIGIGPADRDQGGSLSVTLFENIKQCREAIPLIKQTTNQWHYGNDKSDIVPHKASYDCYPITPGRRGVSMPTMPAPKDNDSPAAVVAPAGNYAPIPHSRVKILSGN